MDAKIAVITGTVFAGVLVAGALAAPRMDGDGPASEAAAVTATDAQAVAGVVETVYHDDDDDDDDGRYAGDDRDEYDDDSDGRGHDDDEDDD